MAELCTNRDLYLAVLDLVNRQDSPRSLEEYLRALWQLAVPHQASPGFALSSFFELLATGFTADAPPFHESWRTRYEDDLQLFPGFAGWEARILRQIVDLHEMDESGQLAEKLRYFGINSPRGSRWYNFDPATFLECAVCGSFGGWEPGDDTGRDFVPGLVTAIGPDGQFVDANPEYINRPINAIPVVSWDDFQHFLGQGQWYE